MNRLKKASPIITAAKPITTVPTPIVASATPKSWAYKPPLTAIRPLDKNSPERIMCVSLIPWARLIRGLEPTARRPNPHFVESKYQTIPTTITTRTIRKISLPNCIDSTPSNIVLSPSRAIFGRPIIRRFKEYNAVIVRIPARRLIILRWVDRYAVTIPAKPPTKKTQTRDRAGLPPLMMYTALMAAPKGKVPSPLRSAKLRTRKDRKTPRAIKL